MRKSISSLSNTGLSISQAQSISNLCNQRAMEISNIITRVNNYSKTVDINGTEKAVLKAREMPKNIIELLKEKSQLHACQAFLMENLKERDRLLTETKNERLDPLKTIKLPTRPVLLTLNTDGANDVSEPWGWDCLNSSEYNEYLEAEAFAAHIGQYIHKGGILDALRKELPTVPDIEWMTIHDGMKSPVTITTHNEPEKLMELHEKLAKLHREYEQRVNYFKAKVKNLVTAENSKRAKIRNDRANKVAFENKALLDNYKHENAIVQEKVNETLQAFEVERQKDIATYAALKIKVDPRFQGVVNSFLTKLPESE